MKQIFRFILVFSALMVMLSAFSEYTAFIPVTGLVSDDALNSTSETINELFSFYDKLVKTGNNQVIGIFSEENFALSVVQQPEKNPGFVSTTPDVVTLFSTSLQYGSIGLVAHNYLAGNEFFELEIGDQISVVTGTGLIDQYNVIEIRKYQALTPYSPYSSFVDLANPSLTLNYEDLFYSTYGVSGSLILQTCIENEGIDSWGRLFVIAEKVT